VLGSNQRRLSRRFYRPLLPHLHMACDLRKHHQGMPATTTLSTICTYAGHPRRRSRVQLRTGPYSPPKPQAEASPATGYPTGNEPREHHRAGRPRIPGMLRRQPPQQTRAPAIYPRCTLHLLLADPRHWQRRHHPRPTPPDATHPIGPGQHENDTRRKSCSARPDARICRNEDVAFPYNCALFCISVTVATNLDAASSFVSERRRTSN
jgi:hypothetical protein